MLAIGALGALGGASLPVAAQGVPPGVNANWRQIFAEEFDGGELDLTRWTTCYWWADDGCTNLGTGELQWYLPDNVSVEDGALRLAARKEDAAGIDGRTFGYTSGIVTTGRYYSERDLSDRFAFRYGFIEIRAQVPAGQGLWPAIWLLPSDHESKPEIDIMEVLGHRPDLLEMNFHPVADDSQGHEAEVGDLSTGWHVYGLSWQPDAIAWYLDGVEQFRVDDAAVIPQEQMYLIMNLAVGGDWPGDPEDAVLPADFLIDYVRVWQPPLE